MTKWSKLAESEGRSERRSPPLDGAYLLLLFQLILDTFSTEPLQVQVPMSSLMIGVLLLSYC